MPRVVVTYALEPELVEQIGAVDPSVDVTVVEARRVPGGSRARLPSELGAQTDRDKLAAAVAEAEVIFGFWAQSLGELVTPEAPPPTLRWVQLTSAGVDRLDPALLRTAITFTNVSGLAAVPIGEFVIAYMLMLVKGWPRFFRNQQAHDYDRMLIPGNLAGKTVGIVGMGAIGVECARMARALGCRVIGMRRSFRERGPDPVADEGVPVSDLDYLLAESDFVVVAAPLTEETRGMIGAEQLRTMGPDAYLVNIARGALVDEQALIEALRDGTIAGAALDVFEHEPLDADSPLWDLENVILTPHVTGGVGNYNARATEIFCDNLRRYVAGEPLRNVIEADRGY